MSPRTAVFLLVLAGVTLSLSHGQERLTAPKPSTPDQPIVVPVVVPPTQPVKASLDLAKLEPVQQQMLLSAQRGADWLARMNSVNGRFLYGWVPALQTELEGDHYLHQAGAAFA